MQMLINSVVKNEAIRNKQMIEQYEEMIKDLPRGSLICRKNEYYYLKYRGKHKNYEENWKLVAAIVNLKKSTKNRWKKTHS